MKRRSQTGSATAELACLTVAFVLVVLTMAGLGRFAQVRASLDQAVRDAARAGSLRSSPEAATIDATAALDAALANQGIGCGERQVDVYTAELHPGGRVGVRVVCRVSLADLSLLAFPGTHRATASFVAPIDPLIGR